MPPNETKGRNRNASWELTDRLQNQQMRGWQGRKRNGRAQNAGGATHSFLGNAHENLHRITRFRRQTNPPETV